MTLQFETANGIWNFMWVPDYSNNNRMIEVLQLLRDSILQLV